MPVRHQWEEVPTLNLTSMIDVLMLLIIFFMVGTKFVESDSQLKLKLPQVVDKPSPATPGAKKIVDVDAEGQISLDGKVLPMEELTKRLAAARSQSKGLGVVVRGDASSSLQRIAAVLTACKKAGVSDLAISVSLVSADRSNARRK